MDSFRGLCSYFSVGISSAALICLEFWGFEAMILQSGLMSVTETAGMIIAMNVLMLMFVFTAGT
jgi:hypothetical protein